MPRFPIMCSIAAKRHATMVWATGAGKMRLGKAVALQQVQLQSKATCSPILGSRRRAQRMCECPPTVPPNTPLNGRERRSPQAQASETGAAKYETPDTSEVLGLGGAPSVFDRWLYYRTSVF